MTFANLKTFSILIWLDSERVLLILHVLVNFYFEISFKKKLFRDEINKCELLVSFALGFPRFIEQ